VRLVGCGIGELGLGEVFDDEPGLADAGRPHDGHQPVESRRTGQ